MGICLYKNLLFYLFFLVHTKKFVHCDVKRLHLTNLVRHPCRLANANLSIILPTTEDSVFLPQADEDNGCYMISGTITIKKRITGTIQIYVETQYGNTAKVASCHNADRNNCGGVGSCIFCDTCNGGKSTTTATLQLRLTSQQLDCSKGLNPGSYTNLGISFCLPTLDEFLNAQNMNRDKWDRFYKRKGQTVYQTFYIFNHEINLLSGVQLQHALRTGRNLIGCDAIVADVTE